MAVLFPLPQPTGKVILIDQCFPVKQHFRSSHTRNDWITVSASDVDRHTRCLIQGVDSGLIASGLVDNGYSIVAFRRRVGTRESFVSKIYFRTKAEAEQAIKELDSLIKPTEQVGWKVNELKQSYPASSFDTLDYEGKIKNSINQLRTRLGDDGLDLPKVFARQGIAKAISVVDNVREAANEAAAQAQRRAEDVAETVQESISQLGDRLQRQIDDQLKRMEAEIRAAANDSVSDVVAKVTKYRKEVLESEKTIAREERNVTTLENSLRRLKDPRKREAAEASLKAAKARLKSARLAKARYDRLIDGLLDVVETSKGVKRGK